MAFGAPDPDGRVAPIRVGAALRLRPAKATDLDFLRTLFHAFRADEMRLVPWSDAAKAAFLDDQFRLQPHHFTTVFADADFLVVERAGAPVGRLYLQRRPDAFLVVDIGFVPAARRRGLGRTVMTWVLDQARAAGAPRVELHVLALNLAARRLYESLGFAVAGETPTYLRMTCPTDASI